MNVILTPFKHSRSFRSVFLFFTHEESDDFTDLTKDVKKTILFSIKTVKRRVAGGMTQREFPVLRRKST